MDDAHREQQSKPHGENRQLRQADPNALSGGSSSVFPGLLLAVAVMLASGEVARGLGTGLLALTGAPPGRGSPVSAMSMAILLGMLLANTVGVSPRCAPGLRFAMKVALRLGIVLVGLRMSFFDVVALGALGVPAVGAGMALTIGGALWLARRLEVGGQFGVLAAASTAVCGVTATLALAPVVGADDREVAYTVANVTLFGLLAMLVYPYLAHLLFPGVPGAAGLFLGMGIHDTSQVMGAALTYRELFGSELALKVATVTKLTRNVFLVATIPALTWVARVPGGGERRPGFAKLFPTFVLGFLAMALVRSLGDAGVRSGTALALGLWDVGGWARVTKLVGETAAHAALGTAMAAVGLTTRLAMFRELGPRPLYLGGGSALLAGAAALLLAASVGPYIGRP